MQTSLSEVLSRFILLPAAVPGYRLLSPPEWDQDIFTREATRVAARVIACHAVSRTRPITPDRPFRFLFRPILFKNASLPFIEAL
jgi:hypothetical protein